MVPGVILLPEPGFFFTVVVDGALPAVMMAGVLNVLLHLWGDEALTLAYLKIFLAAPPLDEQSTNATFHESWHIIIKMCQTTLHYDTLVLAEHLALLSTDLGITRINGIIGIR